MTQNARASHAGRDGQVTDDFNRRDPDGVAKHLMLGMRMTAGVMADEHAAHVLRPRS